ncbi:unnamed protein product [Phyllotreta striolata]|uniref:CRAL-TRIO domain-containing protein n=1 Tax=Phyllotreta striolata TaxID=444603 RepID=A0A9N9XN96_PHYSR|nr:unnamed protein product [Phyllotreta striolata]
MAVEVLITDRNKIRECLGKTETDVKNDIETIRNWLKYQKHLPESPTDVMLEFFLTNCKYSIEITKRNIDMYYTVRTLLPEFYENNNPHLEENKFIWDMSYYIPLPKLTENLHRIVVIKFNGTPAFDFCKWTGLITNIFEIRLHEDLILGVVCVVDCKDVRLDHLKDVTPVLIKKILFIKENVGKDLMKEVHVVNIAPHLLKFIELVKKFLKKKIADRIFVHQTIDKIYERIPKELLPRDYGGNEKSLNELWDMWKLKFDEYKWRYDELDKLKVNEELRPTPLENSDALGYYGNFKQLDVD